MRGALLAAVLLFPSFSAPARAAGPELELYFEAMDGTSWQWLFMADAVRRRMPGAKLEVLPLVSRGESGWVSRRGEPELEESARIAWVSAERREDLFNYLNARSLSPWADGWRDAALFSGLDPDELGKKSSEAREKLLGGLYERSAARKADSTALYINGSLYEGGQRLLDLYAAVNAALPEASRLYKPGDTIPHGVPVKRTPKMWVLLSARDGVAGDSNVAGAFKRYFAGIKPKELDYASAEAKKLLRSPRSLPAYVIEDTPEVRKAFEQAIQAGAFERAGKNFVYYDKGKKSLLPLEKHLPGELELFTMSMCPYGVQAANSLAVAHRQGLLPKGTRLRLRYIAEPVTDSSGTVTGFTSLQGTPEWEENARQLFIKKTFPDKFFDYLLTRNKDVRSSRWETAAEAAGIDPAAVSAGFSESKRLLAEDVKRARALGVGSSPTFLVDGRVLVTGLGGLTRLKGFEKIPVNPSAQDMACGR